MYKGASQNAQAALDMRTARDQVVFADDGRGQEPLDRLRSLQAAIRQRASQIESLPAGNPERRKLSILLAPLQVECGRLKRELGRPSKGRIESDSEFIAHRFIDEAKAYLPLATFKMLMHRAIESSKKRALPAPEPIPTNPNGRVAA